MSEMPAILPSRTCSAIEVIRLSGLTWYGSSVMTICVAPRWLLFDLHHATHPDRAPAGGVGVVDALAADDQAVGREVGALHPLHHRGESRLLVGLVVLQAQ